MIRSVVMIVILAFITSYCQVVGPKISVQESEYTFGDINQNDIVRHSFQIANTGGDVLTILEVKASCGCTAATPDKKELKPGESTQINVTFNSKGRKGPQTKTITIKTNDPESPVITLMIKGNVIAKENNEQSGAMIYLPEVQHDFGKVKEGEVVTYSFTFQNKGKLPLEIKNIQTSCGCTAAVVDQKNLNPGESSTIKVNLDTKNRQGRMTRTVTIVSNDMEQPNKVITISADVTKN